MPAEHGTGEHGGFLGFGDAGFSVEPVGGFAACLARIAFVGLRAAICSASNTDQLTRGWQCSLIFCKKHLSAHSNMGYPDETQQHMENAFLCNPSNGVRNLFYDRRYQ